MSNYFSFTRFMRWLIGSPHFCQVSCQSQKSIQYYCMRMSHNLEFPSDVINLVKTMVKNNSQLQFDRQSCLEFFLNKTHFNWLGFRTSCKWRDRPRSPPSQCGELSGRAPCKQTRHWVWLETSCLPLISSPFSPGLLFPRQWLTIHTDPLCYRNRQDNIVRVD